jgi:hypothetical protein
MKRVSLIIAGICLAATLNLRAADAPASGDKPAAKGRTEEQKKLLKEITDKYDTNKDGKLDKDERQKISTEDKERLKKAGLGRGGARGNRKKKDADTAK